MKLRSYTKMDNLEQISQGEEYKIQVSKSAGRWEDRG